MSINLYPHQETFMSDMRNAMRQHKSILAVAPTGFGKTITTAYMAQCAINKGKRVFFTVHRKTLLFQTTKTFDKFNIDYGIIAAGHKENKNAPVQICSIASLKNRMNKYAPPDLLIIDEAHFCGSKSWSNVVSYYKERGCFIVGLTATPIRLSGE